MCTAVKWLTYLDSFHPGLPGLGLGRVGGDAKWEREGGEEKSAVNDYRCKMAVCWTNFPWDMDLGSFEGRVGVRMDGRGGGSTVNDYSCKTIGLFTCGFTI